MGQYGVKAEEDAIREVLVGRAGPRRRGPDPDEVPDAVATSSRSSLDFERPQTRRPRDRSAARHQDRRSTGPALGLYSADLDFLDEALTRSLRPTPRRRRSAGQCHASHGIAELEPPPDLQQRLGYLPQDYLAERRVTEKLEAGHDPGARAAAAQRGPLVATT